MNAGGLPVAPDGSSPPEIGNALPICLPVAYVPRLALSVAEAAQAVGISAKSFRRHLLPELRVARFGSHVLIPVNELVRLLDQSAERTLEGGPHEP